MKDISAFIKEALDNVTKVTNMKVIYRVIPDVFTGGVPNNYSESDMQIYLDDKCLDELPGSNDQSEKTLGDNIKQISDCHFEYDRYTASDKPKGDVNMPWDPKYDENNQGDAYTYYTLKNLKYIMEFSEFNLKNVSETDINKNLEKIFETFNSSKTNEYPIEIELEEISYD